LFSEEETLRFKIGSKQLLEALIIAGKIVPTKNTTPILTNVRLSNNDKGLFMTVTDLENTLTLKIPYYLSAGVEHGECCLPHKPLLATVKAMEKTSAVIEFWGEMETTRHYTKPVEVKNESSNSETIEGAKEGPEELRETDKEKLEKICENCKNTNIAKTSYPCTVCSDYDRFEEPWPGHCNACKFFSQSIKQEPCKSCLKNSNYVSKNIPEENSEPGTSSTDVDADISNLPGDGEDPGNLQTSGTQETSEQEIRGQEQIDPEGDYTESSSIEKVRLSTPSNTSILQAADITLYPIYPDFAQTQTVNSFQMDCRIFKAMSLMLPFASTDIERAVLNAVNVVFMDRKVKLAATDGRIVFEDFVKTELDIEQVMDEPITFPTSVVDLLHKLSLSDFYNEGCLMQLAREVDWNTGLKQPEKELTTYRKDGCAGCSHNFYKSEICEDCEEGSKFNAVETIRPVLNNPTYKVGRFNSAGFELWFQPVPYMYPQYEKAFIDDLPHRIMLNVKETSKLLKAIIPSVRKDNLSIGINVNTAQDFFDIDFKDDVGPGANEYHHRLPYNGTLWKDDILPETPVRFRVSINAKYFLKIMESFSDRGLNVCLWSVHPEQTQKDPLIFTNVNKTFRALQMPLRS
jgi:hypothetical protein